MKALRNTYSDSDSGCRYWRIPSSEFVSASKEPSLCLRVLWVGGVRVVLNSVSCWELTNVWGFCCLTPRGISVWAGALVTMSNSLCGYWAFFREAQRYSTFCPREYSFVADQLWVSYLLVFAISSRLPTMYLGIAA